MKELHTVLLYYHVSFLNSLELVVDSWKFCGKFPERSIYMHVQTNTFEKILVGQKLCEVHPRKRAVALGLETERMIS